MTSIYLFRHADTSFPKELIGGRSNEVPLTVKGEAQAYRLGQWMAANYLRPDFIAISPALRTRKTAQIALQAANIACETMVENRLQELTKGDAEGQLRTTINTPNILARMAAEQHDFKYENGESNNVAADRLLGWVDEMISDRPGQTIFGITHGIVTRCLVGRYLGWSFEEFNASTLDNTAGTILRFDDRKLQGIEFNIGTQELSEL